MVNPNADKTGAQTGQVSRSAKENTKSSAAARKASIVNSKCQLWSSKLIYIRTLIEASFVRLRRKIFGLAHFGSVTNHIVATLDARLN